MGITNYQRVIYDDAGRAKPSHYVYAAFGEADNRLVCKIGYSSSLHKRLYAIAAHSGTPITTAKAMTAHGLENARSMEAMLHIALEAFHSHHEWFVFDPQDAEHKARFKAAWQTVGKAHGAKEIMIDIDAMRDDGIQRARQYLLTKKRRKSTVPQRWRNAP